MRLINKMRLATQAPLTGMACAMLLALPGQAAADIRTWAFEATVVSFDDPQGLFGDVRLGDTVRGDFAYNVGMPATFAGEGWEDYDHEIGFHGIRLAIENPRTGEELRYADNPQYGYLVSVFTDDSYVQESGVLFWQDVIAPAPGLFSLVFMQFLGEGVLDNTSLPIEYNLDDWPIAAIYLGADSPFNGIIAQIYSLSPALSGDYDRSGAVDGEDHAKFRSEFGSKDFSPADGNRDGIVNAADYVVWRNVVGATSNKEDNDLMVENLRTITEARSLHAYVPEPATLSLTALMLAAGFIPRRRRTAIPPCGRRRRP